MFNNILREGDEQKLLASLSPEPGWRMADLRPTLDAQKVQVVIVPLRRLGLPAEALRTKIGANPSVSWRLLPLHEDGTPAGHHARLYPPDNRRSDRDLLEEYFAELRTAGIVKESL